VRYASGVREVTVEEGWKEDQKPDDEQFLLGGGKGNQLANNAEA